MLFRSKIACAALLLNLFLCPLAQSNESPFNQIIELLESGGNHDYIGEPVCQLEHALQCAQLAVDAGADDQTVLAALLHDIGHLCASGDNATMGEYGIDQHEKVGAQFVRDHGLPEKVAQLIEGHVQAKRYLTAKYPEYYQKLSDASKQTLEYQGGPMSPEEALEFEKDPLFEQKLQMRYWDEQAKKVGWQVKPLEDYKTLLVNYLR